MHGFCIYSAQISRDFSENLNYRARTALRTNRALLIIGNDAACFGNRSFTICSDRGQDPSDEPNQPRGSLALLGS
jgi:hypothetical protein